jgi:sterol desaturase/sphingolipid hydroxylase (fatty acid hydroxylase superfamily)
MWLSFILRYSICRTILLRRKNPLKSKLKKTIDWVATIIALVAFNLLLLFEHKWPLRRMVDSKLRRLKINVELAAVTVVITRLLFLPAITLVAQFVMEKKMGLLNMANLPKPVRWAAALLMLDYTFYWWHWLTHHFGLLWRFHLVHHTDLDLDVSTAARFHFGEYLLSILYRSLQIALIGIGPEIAITFEIVIFASATFHHSNIRLPIAVERRMNLLIPTPRMHGIHHSIKEKERNSNFGTIFSIWDRLHNTLRLDVPQEKIVIGLPAYPSARELNITKLLIMPFQQKITKQE